jgi:DNA-binding NtrC family response regulator
MRDSARVLVVDDEPLFRGGLVELLRGQGIAADPAADGVEALRLLRRHAHRLVISDLAMPGLDGLGLMRAIKREVPGVRFVLVSGAASVREAVSAIRDGAEDVLEKPLDRQRLFALVATLREDTGDDGLVCRNRAMREVVERARRIAGAEATTLIQGESGTGKEVLARALHHWGPRAAGPFVAVNCAALPDALVESELFGHERGAFTDARVARAGVIEQAEGGSLFLDEIGEMPLDAQAKLLRVIEDRRVRRLGGAEPRAVDVRFIAATNRSLRDLVAERRFREDLYFRLDVMSLTLPPLRERVDDIPLLARHFAERWAQAYGRMCPIFTGAALAEMVAHPWPGNVRELENAVHRALIEAEGLDIEPAHLGLGVAAVAAPAAAAAPAAPAVRPWPEVERDLIMASLARTGGNRRRAAELIGIGERTLRNRLRAYRQGAVR